VRRAGRTLGLAVVLTVALGHAARAGERAEPAGVYRRPLAHDPATLDPARIRDMYGITVAQQLFDGLVQFDQSLTVAPALAEFWKSSRDGLTWTFTLKRNVRFHHGREVTADDVVYSFTRILDPRTRSGAADLFANVRGAEAFRDGRAGHVEGLVALDRYTVRIVLSEPLTPFVAGLAEGHAKIVPRDVVERAGEGFGTQPVGTGPFRFVRWTRGSEIVLDANPDHHDGRPGVARVVYRIFPGANDVAMYDEFQRGALDESQIPDEGYRRIVASSAHVYVRRAVFGVRFYGFNLRVKPLDDRRVRQAILHAVDRAPIVDEVFNGRHLLARGILSPGTGYNPRLRTYGFDPQRARDLLAEAGYPAGRGLRPLAVWSSVKERMVREHELIRRGLEAVGIKAEFHYETDWPTFSRALGEGRLPVFLYAWYADIPDPDNILFKLFHSRGARNYFGYASAAVDDLLVRARTEVDLPRRVELYQRAEQLIMEDAPILPIWHYTYERVFQPYVRDVEVNDLGDPYIPLRKIRLDRRR
jgi:peptide/nickel transport system substrate-binding protein/oligopeptide transport system substrate-binding protein